MIVKLQIFALCKQPPNFPDSDFVATQTELRFEVADRLLSVQIFIPLYFKFSIRKLQVSMLSMHSAQYPDAVCSECISSVFSNPPSIRCSPR